MNVKIDQTIVDEMVLAQDKAAAGFWAYPGSDWQATFQSIWLEDKIGSPVATGPDGLLWGK